MAKRKKWQFKTGQDVAEAMAARPKRPEKTPAKNRPAPGKPVRIEIPEWRPMLANEWAGEGWWKLDKGKKEAADFIGTYAMAAGLKFVRHDFRCVRRLDIELQLPPGREAPDPDAMLKVTLDACKRCRVIVDDKAAWCKWDTPTFSRGPILKLVLTVTDIEVGPAIDPNEDPDVKRMLTLLTKRIERKNREKPKQNAPLAPLPVGKRGVPRLG